MRIYRLLLVNEDANEEFEEMHLRANGKLLRVDSNEGDNKDDDHEKSDDVGEDRNIPRNDGKDRCIDLNDYEGEDNKDNNGWEKEHAEGPDDDASPTKDTVTGPRNEAESCSEYLLYQPWGNSELHPEILRTNKLIDREAVDVLYGENVFESGLMAYKSGPIRWQWERKLSKYRVPRQYEHLITKMLMYLYMMDSEIEEEDPDKVISFTEEKYREVCAFLAINNPRQFHVECLNFIRVSFKDRQAHSEKQLLEPLKMIRADKVSFQD